MIILGEKFKEESLKLYPEKESLTLELKRELSDTFLKTVSAFANYCDGKVLFGIAEDGKLVGVSDPDNLRLQIEHKVNDAISPRPQFQLKTIEINGKWIIELNVLKGKNTPYLYGGRAYKRSDTSTISADSTELRNLIINGSGLAFDQLPSQEEKLNFKVLEMCLKETVGLEMLNKDALRSLGLMKGENYLRAAEILADINQNAQSATIIIRFGKTTSEFLDRVDLTYQSLLSQYEGAINMFDRWYAPYEVVEGAKRVSRIRIPKEAYREAVANALIHRRFDLNGAVQIAMHEDRIEVASPGGLPEGISETTYLYSQISIPRNLIVAEVFHRLGIIEKFGTGIDRIRREYEIYGNRPAFEVTRNLIRVILPVINYFEQSDESSLDDRILIYIGKNPMIPRSEIEVISGLQRTRLIEVLNRLVDEGKLERHGAGRGVKYALSLE